jgi:hypothetical protein
MQLLEHTKLISPGKNLLWALLLQNQLQLMPEPFPADLIHGGYLAAHQPLGVWLEMKAKALLIAQGSQDAGRVIAKAFLVEHPDKTSLKVISSSIGVKQYPEVNWVEVNSHGVNREVTPEKVLTDGARTNHRQSPRFGVALRTGSSQIKAYPLLAKFGSAKARMGHHFAAPDLG